MEANSQVFEKQKTLTVKSRFCTRGGTWTRTPIQAQDFKSGVSTDSTTRAKYNQKDCRQNNGAGDGIRTRDPDLGKVVLYQLSYSRLYFNSSSLRLKENPFDGGEQI